MPKPAFVALACFFASFVEASEVLDQAEVAGKQFRLF